MAEDKSMIVKFWGVRGSVPTPLTTEQIRDKEAALLQRIAAEGGTEKLFGEEPKKETIERYLKDLPLSLSGTSGGNTTCIEVQARDSPLIMIDSGTGARVLGNEILGRIFSGQALNPLNTAKNHSGNINLFFTHYHWDHIQGFPFFGPGFVKHPSMGVIDFCGKADARVRLSEVLSGQQQYPTFPVEWKEMPCLINEGKTQYKELGRMNPSPIKAGAATVSYIELTHPDKVFGYAVEIDGKKFVCATDTEHHDSPDPRLVKLAEKADVLYYDSQYLPEEYRGEKGMHHFDWGHSTYEWAIRTAKLAGVKTVVLGHHDPARDDFGIEEMLGRAKKFRDGIDPHLEVIAAYEGLKREL